MKSFKYTNLTALLLMLATLVACEERELPDDGSALTPGGVSTSQMHPNVSSAGGFIGTKAGNGLGEPANVYGSEDDGLMITEYVSDLNGIAPITRGTEITTAGINSINKSFGLLAYYEVTETPVTQPIAAKGLDIDGSCSFASTWGWDAATTQYTTTYHTPGVPTNAMTPINGTPKWRINSTERIWSIYPASSTARIPFNAEGEQDDLKSAIDPESPSSFKFKYTVSTTLENQEDLIFAYNKEARKWKKAGTAPDPNAWVWDDGTNTSFDIKFYHAMAAVKFELNSAAIAAGANVHSITLCYMDASNNIVKNVGVARYGECEVTGDDASTGSRGVSFNWDPNKLSTYKPLHYTYADTYSATPNTSTVAGGYASTGNGVMFMIPQTIPHTISTAGGTASLKIIVEFSKYGSTQYHAMVKDFTSSDITWNAGNYYLYQLSISEFHVPGEILYATASDIVVDGFQGGAVDYLLDKDLPSKGIKNIGLVVNGYNYKDNGNGSAVMSLASEGNGPEVTLTKSASGVFTFIDSKAPRDSNSVDFLPINETGTYNSKPANLGDGTPESYPPYYTYNGATGTGDKTGPFYYVFSLYDCDKFNIAVYGYSNSSNAKITFDVDYIVVIDVEEDPNIPGNWPDFLANISDYL